MSVQFSTTVRNARLDAIETVTGTAPLLRLRTGAKPANCAAARSGTIVATMTLPSDWLADAASGQKAKSGTWQDLSADNAGTIAHFEVMDSGGTTCHMQGSVTITGGGGDMTVDNPVVEAGQSITVTGFTMTEGNS